MPIFWIPWVSFQPSSFVFTWELPRRKHTTKVNCLGKRVHVTPPSGNVWKYWKTSVKLAVNIILLKKPSKLTPSLFSVIDNRSTGPHSLIGNSNIRNVLKNRKFCSAPLMMHDWGVSCVRAPLLFTRASAVRWIFLASLLFCDFRFNCVVKISKRVKDTPIGNGEKNEKKASVINSPDFGVIW